MLFLISMFLVLVYYVVMLTNHRSSGLVTDLGNGLISRGRRFDSPGVHPKHHTLKIPFMGV